VWAPCGDHEARRAGPARSSKQEPADRAADRPGSTSSERAAGGVAWNEPIPCSRRSTPLEEITANVSHRRQAEPAPGRRSAGELNASIKELRGTLAQAEKTLASANALINPD
jgi:hypothetical protein